MVFEMFFWRNRIATDRKSTFDTWKWWSILVDVVAVFLGHWQLCRAMPCYAIAAAGRRITRCWRSGPRRVIWIPLPSLSRPVPSFLGGWITGLEISEKEKTWYVSSTSSRENDEHVGLNGNTMVMFLGKGTYSQRIGNSRQDEGCG